MKQKTYQIVLDGIVITVTKKRIKNMYLRIKKEDGMVLISAPYQMSDLRIRRFAEERLPWIREYQEKYKELKQQKDLRPALSEAEIRRRKVLLKAAVEKLIQKYEQLMRVQVSGVTIRQMKTRWGSCNVKTHHININLALYEKGPECLEYVVVQAIIKYSGVMSHSISRTGKMCVHVSTRKASDSLVSIIQTDWWLRCIRNR